ncbi:MAG: MFS transporter [Blastocatellales bacterium]
MNAKIRLQLSAMMFLQFFVWGAWYVTAPNYLGTIGFSPSDIGWTYAVGPIAAIISPFFVGMIADRFFAAQHVMAAMHLLGGALMFVAAGMMKGGSTPAAINFMIFLSQLTYYPTLAMSNTLAMRNISDTEKDFPSIRVLGTIGWIVAGFALSWLGWSTQINMFYLTAATGILLGLFSLALPHTPPTQTGKVSIGQILGFDALSLLKNRSYLIFVLSSFLICIPLSFYYQITSRIVEMAQFEKVGGFGTAAKFLGFGDVIGLVMTFGQMSEIFFMLVMPFFFRKLGVKWMLAVGMLAWVVRYALFAFGAPDEIRWMIIIGILLHGICYDFFFVTGQIYTDLVAPKHIRAQAQGLLVLFTLGLGMYFGAMAAGYVLTQHTTAKSSEAAQQMVAKSAELEKLKADPSADKASIAQLEAQKADLRRSELKAIEWKPLWGKPALFAAAILIVFLLLFQDRAIRQSGA